MNSERAVASNDDLAHRVVDPHRRGCPLSVQSFRGEAEKGPGRGSRVGLERTRLAAPVEVHAEDFHENPKPDKDPDRFWPPMKERPDLKGPEWGRDAGDNLERVLRFRKQRGG